MVAASAAPTALTSLGNSAVLYLGDQDLAPALNSSTAESLFAVREAVPTLL